jgi:hypothetical protein
VFALDRIAQDVHKGVHIRIFFDVAKKLEQKQTDGIIGEADQAIPASNDRADKRKIDQSSYKSGKAADNAAVGFDFDISAPVGIFGQPEYARLWKGCVVIGVDLNMNAVELFEDAAQAEASQILPQAIAPGLKV